MSSKLSRSVLKEIVKECIMEIFEESFFSNSNMMYENKSSYNKKSIKRPSRSAASSRSNHLDNISYNGSKNQIKETVQRSTNFDKKVDKLASTLTSDPIMADIFKDTASTTLQSQISAASGKGMSVMAGGDAAAMKANDSDPTELFSESAGKWASLAFADPVIKR
jgi:hypothetical protein